MLSRDDPDEVRRRAAAVRAVRDLARARNRRRRAPTVRDYNEALGDEAGMSHASRVDRARQERSKGDVS